MAEGHASWEPSWLHTGAKAVGGLLSHIPGLGGIKQQQAPGGFNWGGALKTAGIGGLEAGGATLGLEGLLGAGQAGVPPLTMAKGMLPGAGGIRGLLGAAKAHPFLTGGAIFGAAKLLGNKPGQTPATEDMKGIAESFGMDENTFKKQYQSMQAFTSLGYTQEEAMAQAFPQQYQQLSQMRQQHKAEQMKVLEQQINPYVTAARDAAAKQAEILQGLVPQISKKYQPLLAAFAQGNQQVANASIANQALAAIAQAAGMQQAPQGGGGGLQDLVGLLQGGEAQSGAGGAGGTDLSAFLGQQ